MRSRTVSTVLVSFVISLQFVIVPFLGSVNNSGKLYFFSFLVLLCALPFLLFVKKIKFSLVLAPFLIILCVFLASSFRSQMPFESLLYTAIFFLYFFYAFMLSNLVKLNSKFFLNQLVRFVMFFGLLTSLLGVYEFVYYFLLGPTRHYLIPYLLPPDQSGRIAGFYGQPNLFALFLTLTLLCYFHWYLSFSRVQLTAKLSYFKFLPPFVVAFVFFQTGSRAGFLSLVLIFCFLLWLVTSNRYLHRNLAARKAFYSLLICIICAFLFYRILPYLLSNLFEVGSFAKVRSLTGAGVSSDTRYVFWVSAILIFLDHPWFGAGLGNYGYLQDNYGILAKEILGFVPYEAMQNTSWAHNEILQLLAEGGIFVFILVAFLLGLFLLSIWRNLVRNNKQLNSHFLFSHLFLLPFVIQSMFSWPLRSPPLLLLFFTFLGLLLAQYPMKSFLIPFSCRWIACALIVVGVFAAVHMFKQELRLGLFQKEIVRATDITETLPEMERLSKKPYSAYRVLSGALPLYVNVALLNKDLFLAERILPLTEQLVDMEGAQWQWYDLARIYLKVGNEDRARFAIHKAIDLMPSSTIPWSFLHYLNMIKASKETGRPLESFFPQGREIDFNVMGLINE